jgi:iron complex outermembrane recepter protein
MKKITLLSFVILLIINSYAQDSTATIKGTVHQQQEKSIQSASVALINTKDSSIVKMSITNAEGYFGFEKIPFGIYKLLITAIGYEEKHSDTIELNTAHSAILLPPIALKTIEKTLKAVTVTARKPLIEQRIDRTIINVDAAVTNVGASALEVLEKSPGISVDKDGNISLKGKQGVQVFVDGKPTYLSGADLANMLRNMTSNQLEQVEIMTNPPAKYEAAGNSGVINIKTKKNKQLGYNGSVTIGYGQGKYPKLNESINFNYRKNKINFFTNISYSYRKNFQDIDIQRKFVDPDTKQLLSYFDQTSNMLPINQSLNGKIGLDFYATKNTTLGVVLTGFNNPSDFFNNSYINISNAALALQSITKANTTNGSKWKNVGTNLNFKQVLDTSGQEISADIDYLKYNSTDNQQLVNAYYNSIGQPVITPDTLLGNLPQTIAIYAAKVDYVHPLQKGAKIEAGLKTSYVETDNDAVYDSLLNNIKIRDIGRSNHFIYKENVYAAYLNYSQPFTKKLTGQLGLRLEGTVASGNQLTTGEKFSRRYAQLFPTLFLQYTANEKNTFGINYGRRINRPDYADLNPFILFLDRYTFEQGNPNLQPQFSHNVELSHTFKGFLTTTLNYSRTNNIINQVLEQNAASNETFVKKANIATQRQYGISVNAGMPIQKWWTMNVYANVFNNNFQGVVNNGNINTGATSGQFNVSNQFKFDKGWGAELSGYYQTPAVEGVFKIQGFGMMNMGCSKQVLKDKGAIRFNVRDVLWSQKIKGTSQFGTIDAAFQQMGETRVANISFTYRFNKGKATRQERSTGGASEEQNRVKSGGD